MPSIAMCKSQVCPSRNTCFRFVAEPSKFQSYAEFAHDGKDCSFYIEARSKSQVRRLKSQTEVK